MALYVVMHKTYGGFSGTCISPKKVGHTYVCGEESEVKKLVDDLNKSISTHFPLTDVEEAKIFSEIAEITGNFGRNPENYNDLKSKQESLYRKLNDDSYDYWDYELVNFLDVSSARAFLM